MSVFKQCDKNYIVGVFLVSSLLSPCMRAFSKSIAGFHLMPEQELFGVAFLLCICRSCTNYLMLTFFSWFSFRIKVPEAILLIVYLIFPVITQVLDYQDINSQRETSMRQSATSLQIFQFNPGLLFESSYSEAGKKYVQNDAVGLIMRQIASKRGYYVFFVLMVVAFVVALLVFVIVRYRQILKALGFNISCFKEYEQSCNKERQNLLFYKILYGVLFLFMLTHFGLCISYMSTSADSVSKLAIVAPGSWVFGKSLFRPTIGYNKEMNSIQYYREHFDLPDNRVWLDQREEPEYPFVHAPKEVADAYNGKSVQQVNNVPDSSAAPNVVIAFIESLSPSPHYLDNDFISNQEIVYHGKMYDDNYLPNLNKLLENGIGFSGLASQSFPTYGGWIGFVAGNPQQDFGISLITDQYNDLDDIPSFFRDNAYFSQYVSTSPLEFDSKSQYCFRGNKQKRGPKFLSKLPRWFDEIHYYYPKSTDVFNALGISSSEIPPLNRWSCDRLTAHQMIYHSEQYFKNRKDERPLFTLWTTVDTHGPFMGYDDRAQYQPFTFGKGLDGGYSRQQRNDRYSTLLKYTDNQVGKVIDYYMKERPNTIFIAVGDHGARDVGTVTTYDKIEKCEGTYSADCKKKAYPVVQACKIGNSGNDAAMTTTAVISYFGQNETIKSYFENHKNDVYTLPTDHQDLVYTIEKLVSDCTGKPFVSARQGRNLFQLMDAKSTDDLAKHISVRSTGYSLEYTTEKSLMRSHSLSNQNAFWLENAIYPSCIAGKGGVYLNVTDEQFKQIKTLAALLQKTSLRNRLFSYQFRDLTCVNQGDCEFPLPNKSYHSPMVLVWYLIAPSCALAIFSIIGVCLYFLSRALNQKYDFKLSKCGWKASKRANKQQNFVVDLEATNTERNQYVMQEGV